MKLKAYLLSYGDGLWMAFGFTAVEAAESLPAWVNPEKVSVSGSWDIIDGPIDLRRLWPWFTNNPSVTVSSSDRTNG